jgi:hypothetical protein
MTQPPSKLFVPVGSPIAESAARALDEILQSAPVDTVKARVIIRDGNETTITVAAKFGDAGDWAVGIGGFFTKRADGDQVVGGGIDVSWD